MVPMGPSDLTLKDLERPKSRYLMVGDMHVIHTSASNILILMTHKIIYLRAGLSAVPTVYLIVVFETTTTSKLIRGSITSNIAINMHYNYNTSDEHALQ